MPFILSTPLANCAKPRDIGRRSDDGSIGRLDLIRRAEPLAIQWKSYLIPLMALVRIRLFPLRDASVCCFVLAD